MALTGGMAVGAEFKLGAVTSSPSLEESSFPGLREPHPNLPLPPFIGRAKSFNTHRFS